MTKFFKWNVQESEVRRTYCKGICFPAENVVRTVTLLSIIVCVLELKVYVWNASKSIR